MNGKTPKLALGAWSWGTGNAGGDAVFGNHLSEEDLKPVFDKALEWGLNLWDTAPVYGDGSSEKILGSLSGISIGGISSSPPNLRRISQGILRMPRVRCWRAVSSA